MHRTSPAFLLLTAALAATVLLLAGCTAPRTSTEPIDATLSGSSKLVAVRARDGERIVVERAGAGPPAVVLLHGWGTDRQLWRRQLPLVAARHGAAASIDLPGHGDASRGRGTPSVGLLAADVRLVLERLGAEDVILVGHSMGGLVALETAALAPDRVRAVVGVECLVDPRSRPDRREWDALRGAFQRDFPGTVASFSEGMFREETDPALQDAMVDEMAGAPPLAAVELLEDVLFADEEGLLERCRVPVRCINADLRPTHAELCRALARDYDLRILPASGHFPMLEHPKEFTQLLLEVLDELQAPGARNKDAAGA